MYLVCVMWLSFDLYEFPGLLGADRYPGYTSELGLIFGACERLQMCVSRSDLRARESVDV